MDLHNRDFSDTLSGFRQRVYIEKERIMGGGWWVEVYWQQDKVLLVSWVFWLFVSIVLHELAHGFAAIRCGDRTPIELGHMTPNPLVHMGPASLIAFALFGLAWGSMPVNPSRFR
ncbi:hypothetical protein MNBD_PLANCTO03-1356, partial [hydrothermal vent metagenome]